MLETIRQIANKTVKQKYPLLGENRYTSFDVAVIVQSFIKVAEYQNEISLSQEEESELQATDN